MDRQLDIYNQLRKKANVELQVGDQTLIITNALARLTRMEQWLSCPWIWDSNVEGIKLKWLKEWAEGFNQPAMIVTRFKASAHRIAKELECKCAITGDISEGARHAVVKRWRGGESQFIVGTIHTVGTGLSFERAHALVCYDQLHDPIMMEQVYHRVHRITSDHPVQIIYLYIEGTTNEVVYSAFKNRWDQIELVRMFLKHLQDKEEGK